MRAISAALAAVALALVAPAHAVDQPSTYPGCAERQADVPWGGAVTLDLSACQSFGLGVLATPPAHGQASPAPDAPAEQFVYVHGGTGPAGGGEDHFVVLDDNSDRIRVRVRIAPPSLGVAISPGSLPGLRAGTPMAATLAASGGQAPYAFRLGEGTLPPGLSLSADGRLQGAPTRRGPYAFSVVARDARGAEGRHAYAGDVAAAKFALAPASATVVRGQRFELKLSAGGGVPPHRYSLEPGGTLPPGITLSDDGWLRGVVAVMPGDYRAGVRVTDASTGPGESFEVEPLVLRLVAPPAISLEVVPDPGARATLVVDRGQALAVATHVVIEASGEGLAGLGPASLPRTVLILPGERRARAPLPPEVMPAGAPGQPITLTVSPGPGYRAGARVEARLRSAR
ncbi:MAG TPA: hypothetical protein DC063_13560 [Arenimonas sp.]|nr:MAG: hypothetical protein A2X76_00595 [Xanthomonadales bacterium GWF1_69_6]HBD20997.1 hypothetical protein [Arenimonas sp.]